ncbi:ABC transporter substrate-binding protein [Paenibacillus hodogayensis]|uniref:ABC transporter substrate-binding protein n=1 Tax=Paenibacillus hodogayensis TaxID=279208 RepID=A0ABV5VYL2_9BACL
MKKMSFSLAAMTVVLGLALGGCSGSGGSAGSENGGKDAPSTPGSAAAKKPEDFKGEITVWKGYNDVSQLFMKKYPNVKVNMDTPEKPEDKFTTALATGTGAPDVIDLSQAHFHKFKAMEGLENLLAAPYNAGDLKKDFLPLAWEMSTTLDGKRLYGLPWRITPEVMFYRADIFEENGFPSDPAEVSKLIADPNKFFDMAQKLRAKGHYFFRMIEEVTDMASPGVGYYDNNLNYLRNTDVFANAIDYAKRATQLDLVFPGSKEEQDRALNSGKLITYYGGIYRLSTFQIDEKGNKGSLSENQGKWRVASLPFGQTPGLGYGMYVIPSQSKNKELAWEYIKFAITNPEAQEIFLKTADLSPYKPVRDLKTVKEKAEPAMGGQKVLQFGFSLMDKMLYQSGNPLDEKASGIWKTKLSEGLTKNQDSRAVLKTIMDETEKAVSVEKEALKKTLGK